MLLKNLKIDLDKNKWIEVRADVIIKRDGKFYAVPLNMLYHTKPANPLSVEMVNSVLQQAIAAAEEIDRKWYVDTDDKEKNKRNHKKLTEKRIDL